MNMITDLAKCLRFPSFSWITLTYSKILLFYSKNALKGVREHVKSK